MQSRNFVLFVFLVVVKLPDVQSQSTFFSFIQLQAQLNLKAVEENQENFNMNAHSRRVIEAPEHCKPPKALDRFRRCRLVWG